MKLTQTIFKNLIYNEEFLRKVFPFLKLDYFNDSIEREIYKTVHSFITEYNSNPTIEVIKISLNDHKGLSEEILDECHDYLKEIQNDKESSKIDWLIKETEKFCKDQAIYNAVKESITILEGKDKVRDKGMLPQLLSDALGVSFDPSVGHDYIDSADERFEFYHRKEERIPYDLEFFNKITRGGLPTKTLNVILAGTGTGKSLFMCHQAASCLSQGKNVLYITLEMSEERIAERIDANLLNVKLDDLENLSKETFEKKIAQLKSKLTGKLIIKEYPTSSASVNHFRSLLNELKLKRKFKPDIIFVDYINICASSRFKAGSNANSYTLVKAIAEELRGFAVEENVPVVSATQTTRSGFGSSDPELTDTSESFGLPATADFMFALVTSEELDEVNQIMVKQLKNRYKDPTHFKRFTIGVDRSKMRLYDVEQQAQEDIVDSGQDRPLNTFGDRENSSKFNKFSDFKF